MNAVEEKWRTNDMGTLLFAVIAIAVMMVIAVASWIIEVVRDTSGWPIIPRILAIGSIVGLVIYCIVDCCKS